MSVHNGPVPPGAPGNGRPLDVPELSKTGFWHSGWQALKVLQARLRFVAILAAVGAVVANWDLLVNYYEKWTRPLHGEQAAVSADTEYFCPMHPFIVRDDAKEKCPICHMDLARRKKGSGEPEPLPPGTVSRVQLTPYRVALAGVQITPVEYRPLAREVVTFGSVEFNETTEAHIAARQKGRVVKLFVNYTGQEVQAGEKLAVLDVRYSPDLLLSLKDLRRAVESGNREAERLARERLTVWDIDDSQVREFLRSGRGGTEFTITSPIAGHVIRKYPREGNFVDEGTPLYDVADLSTVWVLAQVYEGDQGLLQRGMPVRAMTPSLPGEEFAGTLDFVYPHLDEASRTLAVRFHIPNPGHRLRPGMYATVRIEVPPARVGPLAKSAAADQAMASAVGTIAAPCAGGLAALVYAAGRQASLAAGLVPAVPDSAVIDTGSLAVVYREATPGTFEGVPVELGPRMTEPGGTTAFYPVLRGLGAGQRIVTQGSFLIDAETRLNPAAGSIYYGGSAGKEGQGAVALRPSTPETADAVERTVRAELGKLDAATRRLAEAQRFCPIRPATRLGAMGAPYRVQLEGRTVLLCCVVCEEKAKADPAKTLRTVEELKRARTTPPRTSPSPLPSDSEERAIRANLARLSREDRVLAEAQKYCPQSDARLGDPQMGVPDKVMVDGRPVFLCCKHCKDGALRNPEATLQKVEQLRARAKAESRQQP